MNGLNSPCTGVEIGVAGKEDLFQKRLLIDLLRKVLKNQILMNSKESQSLDPKLTVREVPA